MNETEIAVAATTTVALVEILKKAGLSGRWALVASAGVSALTMIVWAWTTPEFTREHFRSYYVAYPVVLSAAAGVFNLVDSTVNQVATFKDAGTRLMRIMHKSDNGRL